MTALCFAASYAIAFAMELRSLGRSFGWHRVVLLGFAIAGLVAHVLVLIGRAAGEGATLSSPSDWLLTAALALASAYFAAAVMWPKSPAGIFMLPVVLGLVGAAQLASDKPLGVDRASAAWAVVHSGLLILATVAVCVGLVAGVMYLIQSHRLKQKLPPPKVGFRLPSLEVLEKINARSLALSVWLVAGGFGSGLLLVSLQNRGDASYSMGTDPLVLSLSAMLAWLVVAEVFRLVYPAARGGRKVAYLTVASFVFLLITIVAMTVAGRVHGGAAPGSAKHSSAPGFAGGLNQGKTPPPRHGLIPSTTQLDGDQRELTVNYLVAQSLGKASPGKAGG